jgi:azurin
MRTFNHLLVVVFSLVVLVSCGGKEDKKKEGFSYEKQSDTSEKSESNPNDIVITSNDAMQYNKKEIRVKAGKMVKITLKHIGKMDKNVMGHNFVLLKQGVNLTSFGNKAATAGATEYIPVDSQNDIIAHTKLIGGGETAIIEFDAPEVGEYEFLCSFPGHYGMMKGVFIVE